MKSYIILLLFTIVNAYAQSDSIVEPVFDFRKTNWGMTNNQVKASENSKPTTDQDDIIVYEDMVGGFDCLVIYIFIDHKLVRTKYIFVHEHSNETEFISDYNKIKEILNTKYGKPTEDNVYWLDDLYKDDPQEWGMAICTGGLKYFCNWQTPTTKIILVLTGENFKVNFQVEYNSIAYKKLMDEENKQQNKNDF